MKTQAKNAATATENIATLPARLYHDLAAYETERQKVFFNQWLLFCHESLVESPGQYLAYTLAGWPLVVLKGRDGALKAFHNVCRHRASQVLREGHGKTETLRCMYHGWVYDTNGCLKKAPGFGGDEKSLCDRTSLFPVHVRQHQGLVYICMAEQAPDFDESLGDLPKTLADIDMSAFKFFDMATHKLNCNWKTYVENYMEGYHIPTIHPELNKEIDFASYKVLPGKRIARHETGLRPDRTETAVNNGLWVWLWPHVAINIYKTGMNLELVIPTGPETMELRYCYLFEDISPEAAAANQRTIDTSFAITQEDIDICEVVQKNLKAGIYTTGELSPRHENGLAYFQQLIRQCSEE